MKAKRKTRRGALGQSNCCVAGKVNSASTLAGRVGRWPGELQDSLQRRLYSCSEATPYLRTADDREEHIEAAKSPTRTTRATGKVTIDPLQESSLRGPAFSMCRPASHSTILMVGETSTGAG